MTIHHAQQKKAEKAGYTLTEEADIGKVRAFWPKRSLAVYGNSASDAMTQMQAAIVIASGDEYRVTTDIGDSRLVSVYNGDGQFLIGSPMPPVSAHKAIFIDKTPMWADPEVEMTEHSEGGEAPEDEGDAPFGGTATGEKTTTIERINGVAIDGAVAFAEGTPAGDCPYSSEAETTDETEGPEADEEYDNFVRWNEEWDAAADAKSEEDGADGKGGSVVSAKYRAKYAEMGHPTHCGDWLAETLNEICLNKEGVNLELFEVICGLNGVDTSKYKRSGVGWQGRIRMTGRNLMSKKVFLADGKLVLPETLGGFKQATEEWMAMQRFKAMPKAEQTAAKE